MPRMPQGSQVAEREEYRAGKVSHRSNALIHYIRQGSPACGAAVRERIDYVPSIWLVTCRECRLQLGYMDANKFYLSPKFAPKDRNFDLVEQQNGKVKIYIGFGRTRYPLVFDDMAKAKQWVDNSTFIVNRMKLKDGSVLVRK